MPLADPLRIFTIVGFSFAVLEVPLNRIGGSGNNVLGELCLTLGLALLICPFCKPNAIYLRAFRTDRATARLRDQLIGILGTQFRLAGVRQPEKRASIFFRCFAPGLVALNYSGSTYMEMEADDDWIARLWQTYHNVRIVLIDIRYVTRHLHQEIRMTLNTVGASRCVFLIGQLEIPVDAPIGFAPVDSEGTKSEEDWRNLVAEIVGSDFDSTSFLLLDLSPQSAALGHMEANLKTILSMLPPGVPGELAAGRQFVLKQVSRDVLEKSRKQYYLRRYLAAFAITMTIFVWMLIKYVPLLPYVLVGIGSLFVLAGIFRQASRVRQLSRAHHFGAARGVRANLLLVVLLFFGGIVLMIYDVMRAAL